MAGTVNKVILVANLGADPDVRTTASGQLVCTLSLATSENFTDKAGVRQERKNRTIGERWDHERIVSLDPKAHKGWSRRRREEVA